MRLSSEGKKNRFSSRLWWIGFWFLLYSFRSSFRLQLIFFFFCSLFSLFQAPVDQKHSLANLKAYLPLIEHSPVWPLITDHSGEVKEKRENNEKKQQGKKRSKEKPNIPKKQGKDGGNVVEGIPRYETASWQCFFLWFLIVINYYYLLNVSLSLLRLFSFFLFTSGSLFAADCEQWLLKDRS